MRGGLFIGGMARNSGLPPTVIYNTIYDSTRPFVLPSGDSQIT